MASCSMHDPNGCQALGTCVYVLGHKLACQSLLSPAGPRSLLHCMFVGVILKIQIILFPMQASAALCDTDVDTLTWSCEIKI